MHRKAFAESDTDKWSVDAQAGFITLYWFRAVCSAQLIFFTNFFKPTTETKAVTSNAPKQ